MHRNALIYSRKIFLVTVKARPSSRQNFSLMISKGNLRNSDFARFRRLSTTIGRFFASSIAKRVLREDKKTVSTYSTIRNRSPSAAYQISRVLPSGRSEGVIVCVTEQLFGRKPMFDRLRRKARFALCQMLLRPGEEGRKARHWFNRNVCREHDDEPAESIE